FPKTLNDLGVLPLLFRRQAGDVLQRDAQGIPQAVYRATSRVEARCRGQEMALLFPGPDPLEWQGEPPLPVAPKLPTRHCLGIEIAGNLLDRTLQRPPLGLKDRQEALQEPAALVISRVHRRQVAHIRLPRVVDPDGVHGWGGVAITDQLESEPQVLPFSALDEELVRAVRPGTRIGRWLHVSGGGIAGIPQMVRLGPDSLGLVRVPVRIGTDDHLRTCRESCQVQFNAMPLTAVELAVQHLADPRARGRVQFGARRLSCGYTRWTSLTVEEQAPF